MAVHAASPRGPIEVDHSARAAPPTMASKVGAWDVWERASPARSGRPPREITVPTRASGRSAAAISAAAAPVLGAETAPRAVARGPLGSGPAAQSMAATDKGWAQPIHVEAILSRVCSSIASSSRVQQVEQQRRRSRRPWSTLRDRAVSLSEAAAAAAVGEHDHTPGLLRHGRGAPAAMAVRRRPPRRPRRTRAGLGGCRVGRRGHRHTGRAAQQVHHLLI